MVLLDFIRYVEEEIFVLSQGEFEIAKGRFLKRNLLLFIIVSHSTA